MSNLQDGLTAEGVRRFVVAKYSAELAALGFDAENVPDDFDLLLRGVIDSFGVLELVGSIENEFNVELDLAALDAEQITIVGPLTRFVAENASPR